MSLKDIIDPILRAVTHPARTAEGIRQTDSDYKPHQSIWASYKIRPYFVYPNRSAKQAHAAQSGALTIEQGGRAYNFPAPRRASTVGIIELGGGYTASDLDLAYPDLSKRTVAVSVDGASNSPGSDADGEVLLDTEIIGVLNPLSTLRVYFAPNSAKSFANSVIHGVDDGSDVISISWGGPESEWKDEDFLVMESAFAYATKYNVPVCAASGDNNSDDGTGKLEVDYPASSPHVIACGGTFLKIAAGGEPWETVWNDGTGAVGGGTGGGLSQRFKVPQAKDLTYRHSGGIPISLLNARGVPDVSGNADPVSGWLIWQNGDQTPIGGTSAVAPLWAALLSIIKANGGDISSVGEKLYNMPPSAFHRTLKGNNNVYDGPSDQSVPIRILGYAAGPDHTTKWNACTGLGSPNGAEIARLLGANGGQL